MLIGCNRTRANPTSSSRATTKASSMLKPGVIDISHHQVIPESLVPAQQAGIIGCIHKMTEGTSYIDDKAGARRYLADQAGLMWGLYHFVQPGSMSDQVDFFVNSAADIADEHTLYALDWEVNGVTLDDAVEFMQTLEQRIGRSPVLYSGHIVKEAM